MYKSFENDLTTTFYYSLPHFGSSTQPVPIGYLKCPGVGTKCHILRLKKDDIKKVNQGFSTLQIFTEYLKDYLIKSEALNQLAVTSRGCRQNILLTERLS